MNANPLVEESYKKSVEESNGKLLRSVTEETVELVIDKSIKAVEKMNYESTTQSGNNESISKSITVKKSKSTRKSANEINIDKAVNTTTANKKFLNVNPITHREEWIPPP